MIYLMAPYEQTNTTIVLPSPLPDDTQANVLGLNHKRSMNNRLYTYVKNAGQVRLVYKFRLFRGKVLELQEFVDRYVGDNIRVLDHKEKYFVCNLVGDFDYAAISREEYTEVTLTLEGYELQYLILSGIILENPRVGVPY